MSNETKKRYFIIHTNEQTIFDYPYEFQASQNKKYVHVINAHLYKEDIDDPTIFERPNFVFLHATFVQDDPYEDHIVCKCNSEDGDRKKYEQFSNDNKFTIWLTDYSGERLEIFEKIHLILELMLEY